MFKTNKIKYTAYVAASIDGRIAKDSHSLNTWTSEEDWNFFQHAISKVDVVVVGMNTYKVVEKRLKKRKTIVFSSKYNSIKTIGSVTFLNPAKINFQKFIKQNDFRNVAILGGPMVYTYFLQNKILNELFVTIEPCVFTTGTPMFSGIKFKKHKFILQSVKKLNQNGTLLLKYKNNAN